VAQECLCSMERFLVSVNMKYLGTNAQRVTAFTATVGFTVPVVIASYRLPTF